MNKIIKLIVEESQKNRRVDTFISSFEKKISRTKIKGLTENGFLKINNRGEK